MFKALLVSLVLSLGTAYGATPKAWTFIVFMNGDNNLDSFGDLNLSQMKTVGSTDAVNIIVLRDRYNQSTTAKIYYVQKGSLKTVKDYGKNIDMGDWHQTVELFKFSAENYPADRYAFVVWDHGGGWKKRSRQVFRDISWDDHTGNFITTPQLAQAMAEMKVINNGKKIDLLGMDACLMQMAEVVTQVAPSVDAVVASEEVEPGEGWNYKVLSNITNDPTMSALDFGAKISDEFVKANGREVQSSSVSAAGVVAASQSVRELADALTKFDKISKDDLTTIMSSTQKFDVAAYRDFIDFAKRVGAATEDAELKATAARAETAVRAAIHANFTTITDATGLSVWLPSRYDYPARKDQYKALDWAGLTHWDLLLDKLYE